MNTHTKPLPPSGSCPCACLKPPFPLPLLCEMASWDLGVRNAPRPGWNEKLPWKAAAEKASPGPFSTIKECQLVPLLASRGETAIFSSHVVPAWPLPSPQAGWLWNLPGQLRLHGEAGEALLRLCTFLSGECSRPSLFGALGQGRGCVLVLQPRRLP